MKILMLSWEYPPKNIGGISAHIYYLSHELYKAGHEVHVITCEEGFAPQSENDDGVFVHRVTPFNIDSCDFAKWVMHLNYSMIEKAIMLLNDGTRFDIIHAHDWLCSYSARVLKCSYRIPMVCTIHATEHGRNGGIRTEMQRYISGAEWMLSYEAWKIIVCSNYMKTEVHNVFGAPLEKIWVIPNGVDCSNLNFSFDQVSFRRRFAEDSEKIILFVGRHVFEKGIHILAEAGKEVIRRNYNTKFVIAGAGPMTDEMKNLVRNNGMENKFLFTGFVDSDTKNKLYRVADVAIFPSIYEPFGIVALEAMASGCPVVVSDVGGLGELIEHKKNGLKAYVGVPNSLADNIIELLYNNQLLNNVKENALKTVTEKYTWNKVADLTTNMYNMIMFESKGTDWRKD